MAGGNDVHTKIMLHFNGNLNDVAVGKTVAHVWTAAGSAGPTGSTIFEGASLTTPNTYNANPTEPSATQWISAPIVGRDFDLTSDFTIDFWTLFPSGGATGPASGVAAGCWDQFSAPDKQWAINFAYASTIASMVFIFGCTDGTTISLPSISFSRGVAHHIECVRSGNNFYAFLDGAQVGSTVVSSKVVNGSNGVWMIGFMGNFSPVNFAGWPGQWDEFRVSDNARHTANFTPSTVPYGIEYLGTSATGVFHLVGQAIPRVIRSIRHATGTFRFTGKEASLIPVSERFKLLAAESGRYLYAGASVIFFKNGMAAYALIAECGSYTLSGFANLLNRGRSKLRLGAQPLLQMLRKNPPKLEE
jgi:hypothetical protein